ncbi:hypothetical protein [Tahibacter amnicola]|uniref:Uncharacterized protein n=1 Tax=Tahibacter amnicola TaxID=2976241 RepID=A0ABY6B9S1_9GAMM|nr:hypothetical protein [Tahibacter amnicola]UXI66784.1 hypothetical protein N4264_18795 [Tahibacter amnicola]
MLAPRLRIAALSLLLSLPWAPLLAQTTPPASSPETGVWTAFGGELGFIWNEDLLRDAGVTLEAGFQTSDPDRKGFIAVPIRDLGGVRFKVDRYNFEHFVDGTLTLRGGFRLNLPDGQISLVDASLRPRKGSLQELDLVGADGKTWFYLDRLMYKLADKGARLEIRTMDLRIHPDLAARLGDRALADLEIAQLRMNLNVVGADGQRLTLRDAGNPNWPGKDVPAPGTGQYQADVFMQTFSAQYSRCTNQLGCTSGCTCDGPNTNTDGNIVFTPSSTLKNNVNNGTSAETIPGDPLGKSAALYTADVAWHEKFTGIQAPYDNDQHPYLIWNLYRIDSDGRIQQIGRSGVKHAFLTVNTGADCDRSNGSHVLGRSCGDTYGTGNNDSSGDLGPRSEIIPSKSLWGRCGSIYDRNCDGAEDAPGNTAYSQRLIVKESKLDPSASYLFESWYIVRDDINIYNTMATRPVSFTYGSQWNVANLSPLRLGPAINRWVDPSVSSDSQRNVEVAGEGGHTRVAVKVTALPNGRWRYDYAVANFDYSRGLTQGTPAYSDDADESKRYRVIHNFGFDAFSLPLMENVTATNLRFDDGDVDTANDWTAEVADGRITWTAPENPTPIAQVPPVLNPLNWGTMFTFSFEADSAPTAANFDLHVAEQGEPAAYSAETLVPQVAVVDAIFADNFEEAPAN